MNPPLKAPQSTNQTSSKQPFITFLKVSDSHGKLMRICDTVHECFFSGKKIFISVENATAAEYVDQLLWRLPEESFIPHLITNQASKSPVVISSELRNLNDAYALIHLRPTASPIISQFSAIYDLEDHSSPHKQQRSQERLKAYQEIGFEVFVT